LWLWLRGKDRGVLFHRSRQIESLLMPNFSLDDIVDCFQFNTNLDLTGYEDGTENPKGEDAAAAAIVQGQGEGLDGSSFVAVQQWVHDLDYFESLDQDERDDTFGRRHSDNKEFDDAPSSAHVKRAAQESFTPEAFLVRRSMPWSDGVHGGLVFVAFGKSLDAYEAILRRMTGTEDGVTDALFTFTRPVNGAYYWCPPMKKGKLDLSALGL
jgi:putative iron-dependent peroxidase